MFLKNKSIRGNSKALNSLSDEELIANYKNDPDPKIIGELFDRYTHLAFGVCMKHLKDVDDSKDAVMQIFEDLQDKLLTFDIASFKSWLFTVSRNHCLMILRKSSSHQKHHQLIYEKSRRNIMELNVQNHLFEGNEKEEKISLVKKGIELLKEEQRKCIELLYLQQKSYREVAELTGYDMKKVKSHIQNGKRNLRIFMDNK